MLSLQQAELMPNSSSLLDFLYLTQLPSYAKSHLPQDYRQCTLDRFSPLQIFLTFSKKLPNPIIQWKLFLLN